MKEYTEYLKYCLESFYLNIFFVSILTCSTAGWSNGFIFIKRDKRIVSKTKKVKIFPNSFSFLLLMHNVKQQRIFLN